MKNAKKILLVLLAIVALTLVMSISIFATEHKVATKDQLTSAISSAAAGDTIVMTADINYGTTQLAISKAITLDLGGFTLTTGNAYGGMSIKEGPSIINGKINHTSKTAAIKVWKAARFENLEIECSFDPNAEVKCITGIALQSSNSTTTHVGLIKNVKIYGQGLTQGIETYNCGNGYNADGTPFNVIDLIDGVEIIATNNKSAPAKGMNIYAPIGTVQNSSFYGTDYGVEVWSKGPYNTAIDIQNCTIASTGTAETIKPGVTNTSALYIHDNGGNTTLDLSVDASTTLTSASGVAVTTSGIKNDTDSTFSISVPGYEQNADGSIAACTDHTWADATCTSPKTCSKCNATEGKALPHTYEVTEKVEPKPGVEGKVTYTCSGCDATYSETIEALPEHTHTEVIIPAVRPMPSNNHIGWTAGVKCSECGETIVEPVELVAGKSADANFKINSATLSLGEDIGVTYNATHPANSDADSMYMVFVFDGKEFVVESAGVVSGNRYRFVFKGMRADLMTANIEAYVYAIENGNYVMNSHLQYSVKQYCVNQLKRSIDANFKNLIFSVLNLGDCTQLAVDSTTPAEKLVSNVVTAETGVEVPAIAVETIDPAYNVQAITGDRTKGYDWKSGGIALGSSVQLKLQFTAAEIEGLVLKFDVAGQRTIEIDASELELGSDGRYTVYFQVKVLEYDDTITCTFEKDGAQVGSTLTYSVYTYLVRSYTNTKLPEADRNFMKAVYEYAEAVKVMNGN